MDIGALLFKQFGIDPAQIKSQMEGAITNFQAVIEHFDNRFDILNEKADLIMKALNVTLPDKQNNSPQAQIQADGSRGDKS